MDCVTAAISPASPATAGWVDKLFGHHPGGDGARLGEKKKKTTPKKTGG